ncbi:MAG: hypothetical protein IKI76_03190 [Selenomonadaceae bacterium]|nr:hypothetical protein [Selenomonadaceae bacterium]
MDEKILDWVTLAEKFSQSGDPKSMRTVAREIFELDKNSADGLALMAESSLYLGNIEEAESMAQFALSVEPDHLRGRLIAGGVAAKRFELREQIKIFDAVIDDAHTELETLQTKLKDFQRKLILKQGKKSPADEDYLKQLDKKTFIVQALLFKALCWNSNGLYLAGEPARAAANLLEASTLTDEEAQAAELYSKHLFLKNYRDVPPTQAKDLARRYNSFFVRVVTFAHDRRDFDTERKLHIGYISPDFREHALANFLSPLLDAFDEKNFSVTCYSAGKKDFVTDKLKAFNVDWRVVNVKQSLETARIIEDDGVDILVDLSGHSQDSCLPILAHKPAPVQICALGYTASTGLGAVDYFLSDKVCSPERNTLDTFTEKILRLDTCCLCYAPGLIRDMPDVQLRAPVLRNGFITFGCFNNFAKVSEEVLYMWRAILDGVPRSRLILKGKIFSIDDGKKLVRARLLKMNFPLERVEFRPYSPDYLEQYADIDIALDTFPYTGGTTTCEALYMGVPVITFRGKTHGARLSSSILAAADVKELITASPMDYVKKAIQLSRRKELIAAYHVGLREHVKYSALMDKQKYLRELEKTYRAVWIDCCRSASNKKFNSTFLSIRS